MSKTLLLTFLVVSLFFTGFISYPIAESLFSKNVNIPLSFSETRELDSPSDWIKEDQIELDDNYVKVNLKNSVIAKFANTNSMDPILDEDSLGIEVKPKYPQQIKKGDIIVYDKSVDEKNIIHRVVDIGSDEKGIYYLVKGDNNDAIDQVKVRFLDNNLLNQIKTQKEIYPYVKYVIAGVLY